MRFCQRVVKLAKRTLSTAVGIPWKITFGARHIQVHMGVSIWQSGFLNGSIEIRFCFFFQFDRSDCRVKWKWRPFEVVPTLGFSFRRFRRFRMPHLRALSRNPKLSWFFTFLFNVAGKAWGRGWLWPGTSPSGSFHLPLSSWCEGRVHLELVPPGDRLDCHSKWTPRTELSLYGVCGVLFFF